MTGAHFTPAVATIEQLKKIDVDCFLEDSKIEKVDIVYAGRETTLEGDKTPAVEKKVFQDLGIKFIGVVTGRLQRSFTIYTIPSLLKIPIGLLQALYIILSEKPNVILSFGGYISVPQVVAGWLFSVPIIIHEQTLKLGLANRISSYFADKIATSFEGVFKGEKVILTGNPIRHEIINISLGAKLIHPPGGQNLPNILIMGGNQGSHVINLAIEKCLSKLLKIASVVHVTGDNKFNDFERFTKLKKSKELGKLGERYLVKKWLGKEYGEILQKTNLVVCRAGINTLSELTFVGLPALVIPIPYQGEQQKNAQYFAKLGLVEILPQSKLSVESLLENISAILKSLKHLKEKAKEARKVIIPDAAKRLALETVLLGKGIEV